VKKTQGVGELNPLVSIKTLPPEVSSLLAAGQVIDSLAAVVRELVENSLDAGANRLTVALWPNLWRVQVVDNAKGMTLEDLHKCAQANSTSKISSTEDLINIASLGFRGEALHALTHLADLEICSRSSLEDTGGWRLAYKDTQAIPPQSVAIAPGTIVTVSNLFNNLQMRRQSLPKTSQQVKAVQTTLEQIALCHPYVTWQTRLADQPWFNISPGSGAQKILPQLVKQVHDRDLESVIWEVPEGLGTIELVIGLPDRCYRRRPDWIKIAVNGRIVRAPELDQTILNGFAKTLPRDRYPLCFLHLKISPNQIDWNRHPAKLEIYLHSLSFWQDQVTQAIEKALRLSITNFPTAAENQRVTKLILAAEKKGHYGIATLAKSTTKKSPELSLFELRALSQLNNTYIVAEHSTGMWLIEQHIAHERILYEQLQEQWQIMPLESPVILSDLTPNQVEQLERLQIEIESFGEHMWAIRSAPAMLHQRSDCQEAMLEISRGGDLETAQVAIACRSAIRNGTPLSLAQMQIILDQWKSTRNPRTCPHGRPIYLSLEESSLSRFFRRHWVIGKSHGI